MPGEAEAIAMPGVPQLGGHVAGGAVDPHRPASYSGVAVADLELLERARRGPRIDRHGGVERRRVGSARDDRGDQPRLLDHEPVAGAAAEQRLQRGEAFPETATKLRVVH